MKFTIKYDLYKISPKKNKNPKTYISWTFEFFKTKNLGSSKPFSSPGHALPTATTVLSASLHLAVCSGVMQQHVCQRSRYVLPTTRTQNRT